MTCLNPDRDQLFRLAAADANTPSPRLALALLLDSQGQPSGVAKNTATQPNAGALNGMIASRCKRLRHANNVQRLRYLEKHRALATCSAGDA